MVIGAIGAAVTKGYQNGITALIGNIACDVVFAGFLIWVALDLRHRLRRRRAATASASGDVNDAQQPPTQRTASDRAGGVTDPRASAPADKPPVEESDGQSRP